MITVAEAKQAILSHLHKPQATSVSIKNSIGKILAEPVLADRDFPPFNRVMMDGIAINFDQWTKGSRDFLIEKIHAAGDMQCALGDPAHAIEVMTGAIVPLGANTVIRYEDLVIGDNIATVKVQELHRGQSVHSQGADALKDTVLLKPSLKISAAEVSLLAAVGKSDVRVYNFPKTAIIGSGDELVPVESTPLPHQIRRSNTYAIESAMHEMGWQGQQYHLSDNISELETGLDKLLAENDVLILSGGVSKGKLDFIPSVLEKLGVRKVFHEVSQRPGKPMWFGTADEKQIFALPGNPVSTFMCFYKYVKPWLMASMGCTLQESAAVLATDFTFTPNLTYFLQVRVQNEGGRFMAYPDQGGGSGDFANLSKIDGFLELPSNKNAFKAGEAFPYIPFRL